MKTRNALIPALALALALVCALFAGCGGKNGKTPASDSDLTPANVAPAPASDSDLPAPQAALTGEWASRDFDGAFVFTFNADGTGNYDASGTDMPFTYEVKDGRLSILYEGDSVPFETPYTLTAETLTIKDSSDANVVYNRK